MKSAVIVVSQLDTLQHLHKYLPEYKLTTIDQAPSDPYVVIHLNIQDQQKLIQYISFLKLYGYDTRSIIIDDGPTDYKSILSQLECFKINNIIIGKDRLTNDAFMQSVVKQVTFVKPVIAEAKMPIYDSHLISVMPIPVSENKDIADRSKERHGREVHSGHRVGKYLQPPPMLFTRDGHNVWMGDMYRGESAFLILGGPSFSKVDKSKLDRAGVLTMGVNNSVKTYRPNLWISVDDPTHFMKSIWFDPKITKFVPYSHSEKSLFDNEAWQEMTAKVGDCPNVWFYKRNEHFIAKQFLFEDTVNWGNHKDHGGGRSVMLAAIRVLFYLGIRKIYLLGCDFKMDENTKYHFEQDRAEGSIKGNNSTYELLVDRFTQLKPIFEANGLNIYNCNPDSGLKVFPFVDFDEAIKTSTAGLPADLSKERTVGLYERTVNKKKKNEPK